jgi:solute:Na+ symporter, SSS family
MAGKRLPLYMAASALFATWFGSESILGAPAKFMEHGLMGIIEDPFGAALCLFLSGLFIARPLYNLNLLTFSDFFRVRYNCTTEFVSALVMVPSYFSWIAAQLIALGILMHLVFGIDQSVGVVASAVFVLAYTFMGGMWSVSITDFVQTVVIVGGLVALAVILLLKLDHISVLTERAPAGFFRFLPEAKPIPMLNYVAAWATIGLGSIPQQDVFQRVMAAKDLKTSIRSCYVSALMYLTVAFLPILICYAGSIVYPDILEVEDKQMMLPALVQNHLSPAFQVLFFGALASAILSTCSGAMLAPATVIGENILKPLLKNRVVSDAYFLRLMRWSLVGVTVVTTVMALEGDSIFELVAQSSAFSLVSLFVPLMAGLYWKKATATGALLSMVLGLAAWIGAGFIETEIPHVLIGLTVSFLAILVVRA